MAAQDTNSGFLDGAIAMSPPAYGAAIDTDNAEFCVTPDRSNIAAQALAEIGKADGDAQGEFAAVEAWLNWYIAHLNWPDQYGLYGTVYNYKFDPATGQWDYTTGSDCGGSDTDASNAYYDSSDSYASSFLSAVEAFVQADPGAGAAWAQANSYNIGAIGSVMLATQQSDGLIAAKPDAIGYQLLEDNSGDIAGGEAIEWLEQNVLNNSYAASWWAEQVSTIEQAVESYLWDSCAANNIYCTNYGATGTSWSSWSDSYAQVVAIGSQGLPSTRVTGLRAHAGID